jgi:Chaperonin GroEL (HSP60 family)
MQPGLEQYAVKKFATALEIFAKTLAENTGVKATEVISKLYAAHEEGKKNHGFDIDVRKKAELLLTKLYCYIFQK